MVENPYNAGYSQLAIELAADLAAKHGAGAITAAHELKQLVAASMDLTRLELTVEAVRILESDAGLVRRPAST